MPCQSTSTGRPLIEAEKRKAVAPREENAAFENGLHGEHTSADANSPAVRILASRSTGTATQRMKALELLKVSPQTTYSLRRKGISHPAQRLKELIEEGHVIVSTRVSAVDSDGFTHVGVALYSLVTKAEAAS